MKIALKSFGLLVVVLVSIVLMSSLAFAQGFQIYPDSTYGPNTGRGFQMYPDGTYGPNTGRGFQMYPDGTYGHR